MEKMRKKSLYYVIVLSLIMLIVGGYYGIRAYKGIKLDSQGTIQKHNYYTLRGNATAYQEEIHNELIALLDAKSRDNQKIVASIVQNYVADYYTWTNKLRYNDITAVQFVNKEVRSDFYQASLDTFYNDLGYYIQEGKHKDTLEVEKVTPVNVETINYEIGDTEIEAYLVHVTWTYKESTALNTNEYQKEGYFVVQEDEDKLFSILEAREAWGE